MKKKMQYKANTKGSWYYLSWIISVSGLLYMMNILLLITINLVIVSGLEPIGKRRSCKTLDCSNDPDVDLNVPQIIRRHGYPSESVTIETDDGYLLTLHRIPGTKSGKGGGQPVFLQHGLLGSSADWIVNGNNCLAFTLADQGYDVWLGNARGNYYSTGHSSLSIHSAEYWNFTWHDMALHDLPAALYHVSNVTNKPGEIIYIGHSMGTTMFWVFSSMRPQAAKNIKIMIALAPVAYMTHIKSPIRYLAPFANDIEWLAKYLGIHDFLPNNKILKFLSYDCELLKIDRKICENIIFAICGFDKMQFNEKILPTVLSHDPAGTSTKTVIHYAQEIKNEGNFQMFDYGSRGNLIEYGTIDPPKYNLDKIKRPVYLMYAENDWLASPIDVERLARNLTTLVGSYKIKFPAFNHVDFIFGKNATQLVYKPLLQVLQNYTEV